MWRAASTVFFHLNVWRSSLATAVQTLLPSEQMGRSPGVTLEIVHPKKKVVVRSAGSVAAKAAGVEEGMELHCITAAVPVSKHLLK